jgi:hypothetical protein
MIIKRWYERHEIIACYNYSSRKQEALSPFSLVGTNVVIDSALKKWGGHRDKTSQTGAKLLLAPESFLLFTNTHV